MSYKAYFIGGQEDSTTRRLDHKTPIFEVYVNQKPKGFSRIFTSGQ